MIRRVILSAFGVALTVVGLIGLALPILPGIPLLVLAALCFSAASSTLAARLDRHPAVRGWRRQWRCSRGLPLLERAQLAFWLTLEATTRLLGRR